MPIHDISLPLSNTLAVWPKDPSVRITQPRTFEQGDHAQVSHLDLGAHSGTHIDTPAHFIPGGANLDDLDLEVLVGPALVVDAGQAGQITPAVLDTLDIPRGTTRLLFRTRNSILWEQDPATFHKDFVAISEAGAHWLIDRGLRLVGVDYLSVAPYADTGPTHRALLGAGIIALEGLNLAGIAPGIYQLICLPLRIAGVEGAPARAILID